MQNQVQHTYLTLKEQIAELKKQATAQGKSYLEQAAKVIFDKYPELDGFRWHQYTPSFNDGEPCEFSVSDVEVRMEGDEEDEYEWKYDDSPGAAACEEAAELVHSVDDEQLKDIFGNNIEVTVTRDGVSIDEYDCGY